VERHPALVGLLDGELECVVVVGAGGRLHPVQDVVATVVGVPGPVVEPLDAVLVDLTGRHRSCPNVGAAPEVSRPHRLTLCALTG
jgi:hypothetical protein